MKQTILILAVLTVGLTSCTKYGNCVVCKGSVVGINIDETYCDSNKNNKEFADEFVKAFGGECR